MLTNTDAVSGIEELKFFQKSVSMDFTEAVKFILQLYVLHR